MRRELQTNERHQVHIYLAQSQISVCVIMQFSDVLERNILLDVSHQNGFHYGLLFGHRVLITGGFLYGHRVLHGSGQRHHSAPPRLAHKAGTWDEELGKRVCLFAAHKRDGRAANNAAGMGSLVTCRPATSCNVQVSACHLPSKQGTCNFDVLRNRDDESERHGLGSSNDDGNEELDERDGEAANNASGMPIRVSRRQQKKKTKKARIAEANYNAGIAEAKEAGITKGEIQCQTKEAQLAQAKVKWKAELPKHRAMAAHVKKEKFDSEDEEDLVAGLYTKCGFDMHATYEALFFS